MKSYTANVEYDASSDDYYIALDDKISKELGWNIGDTLIWKDNKDGTFTVTKKENMEDLKLFLVETVSIFRHRYAIKAKSLEHAYDTVVLEEATEISQKHIDENIVSGREITEEEYIKMYDEDNEYSSSWDKSKKLSYIHIVDYDNEYTK